MWVRPAVGKNAGGAAGTVRDAGMTRSWMAVRAAPSGTKTAAAARIDARRVAVRRFNVAANVIGRALPFDCGGLSPLHDCSAAHREGRSEEHTSELQSRFDL